MSKPSFRTLMTSYTNSYRAWQNIKSMPLRTPISFTLLCEYKEVDPSEQKFRRHYIGFRLLHGNSRMWEPSNYRHTDWWKEVAHWCHDSFGRNFRGELSRWHHNTTDCGFYFKDKKDAAAFKFQFHQRVFTDL